MTRVLLYSCGMELKDDTTYEDILFSELDSVKNRIKASTFERCEFVSCDFREAEFMDCRFTERTFQDSDLSLVKFTQTGFTEIQFDRCKIVGVNWTTLDWKGITVVAPVEFCSCDISFSVFRGLRLPGLKVRNCKAREVDFVLCDLTGAEFVHSDLANTRFSSTKLNDCDFRESSNYIINPTENSVAGANFNFPDVLNLLSSFEIHIDKD